MTCKDFVNISYSGSSYSLTCLLSFKMAAPTDVEYELHVLMLSKSKLKSSIRSSTLLAGFALVTIITDRVIIHYI